MLEHLANVARHGELLGAARNAQYEVGLVDGPLVLGKHVFDNLLRTHVASHTNVLGKLVAQALEFYFAVEEYAGRLGGLVVQGEHPRGFFEYFIRVELAPRFHFRFHSLFRS